MFKAVSAFNGFLFTRLPPQAAPFVPLEKQKELEKSTGVTMLSKRTLDLCLTFRALIYA